MTRYTSTRWLIQYSRLAVVLHVEDLIAVVLAGAQVGIPALELNVDALAAGLAVVVLELHFTIDAVVTGRKIGFASPAMANLWPMRICSSACVSSSRVAVSSIARNEVSRSLSALNKKRQSCARRDRSSAAAR